MYSIGLENGIEGRSMAWVLGHPGCFSYGADADEALAGVAEAISSYREWITKHSDQSWLPSGEIRTHLVEVWECFTINEDYERAESGYEVNAWFLRDWKPLTAQDVERGLNLLDWTRRDLLSLLDGIADSLWDYDPSGQGWSIANIVRHVGNGDWWYLARLGLEHIPRSDLPSAPLDRIALSRSILCDVLPTLVGSNQVVGIDGEFWSPRKLLRRAVWHERDHTEHIRQVLLRP